MKKGIFYNVFSLVPRPYRSKGFVVICLLTFSALLDLFSLASFLPLIILIIEPDQLTSNTILFKVYSFSQLNDPVRFAIALTLIALLFIFLKTQIATWITYRKANYAYQVANAIADKALSQYLVTPYAHFTSMDHAREVNRISNLPLILANNFIIPAGTILAETLITLLLVIAIAFYDIRVFLFLLVVLAPLVLVYRLKKNKIKNTSQEIKKTYPLLLKYTIQAVEGLMDIRTFRKEDFFRNRFAQTFKKFGEISSSDHTLNTGTARTTEFIAALCIGALLIYALLSGKPPGETILILTIYSGVSFRTIPSINRIFASIMQIRTHEYVIEELTEITEYKDYINKSQAKALNFKEKIALQDICFNHHGCPPLLRNASVVIPKGGKIILLGRSGSGKTTLLLIMMRLLKEQSGEIIVDGKRVTEEQASAMQALIGYVPQNPYVLDATILENIAFGIPVDKIDRQKVNQIIHDLDLEEWIQSLPDGLTTTIGEKGTKLSGGQRQRLAIARVLYHDAEILLLDEITNQLDRKTELEVMQGISKLAVMNKTIILITHRPELWKFFDSAYELKNGHLISVRREEFLET